MGLNDCVIKNIRECKLEWHCKEITIFQSTISEKILLEGYGIIKISENGGLFVEFVCNKAAKDIDFNKDLPTNSLTLKDRLTMKAILLNGTSLTSEGFRIRLSPFERPNSSPVVYLIGLSEIKIESFPISSVKTNQSLYFEFSEEFLIPRNVSNKTESTLGTGSFSWNQTTFKLDNFQLDIIRHKKYTSVRAYGNDIDFQDIENALKFYLGFSSGLFPQSYYSMIRDGETTQERVISVNRELVRKSIPAPISHLVYDENNKTLDEHHLKLFENVLAQIQNDRKIFESVYSQWKRVWHAFLTPEISVLMLTLSVSIEGLLNDIFFEQISIFSKDEAFEEEKLSIVEKINAIEGLTGSHKKSISDYVGKWGNVHAKKALEFLKKYEVISREQMIAWEKVRNASAHPRLVVRDEARRIKEMNRTTACLGLFYRLILNVFAYKGAQYSYEYFNDKKLIRLEHVPILPNSGIVSADDEVQLNEDEPNSDSESP